jgi:hypothetical protein
MQVGHVLPLAQIREAHELISVTELREDRFNPD